MRRTVRRRGPPASVVVRAEVELEDTEPVIATASAMMGSADKLRTSQRILMPSLSAASTPEAWWVPAALTPTCVPMGMVGFTSTDISIFDARDNSGHDAVADAGRGILVQET
ncbi:MAG TPA: hypothetical protein VKA76_15335 [Gammaproteobacteria bacterium]|nr:hypothetical protein [Gammaproteobacteria bacterium]